MLKTIPTKKDQILSELSNYIGTESYNIFNYFLRDWVLTDGALFLAERCGAFWLMEEIGFAAKTYPSLVNEPFVCWTLKVEDHKAELTAEDGNEKVLFHKKIDFTDFPLDQSILWVERGAWGPEDRQNLFVIMLPSEH